MQIDLVAYTLEEPPFFRSEAMGSAVHANALKMQNVKVRAMFSLEMIGYFSDAEGSQKFPNPILKLFYPSRGNFIAVVGDFSQLGLVRKVKRAMRGTALLPVYSINAPGWLPGIDFSDHLNYWRAGYPAVMITDTSFYRNENYHTAQDTAEKLDYARMAKVVLALHAALLDLSQ
jgi:Zn-dependent M28 family amino/carboxypeptidase